MEFSGCSLLHTTVSRAAGGATIPGRVVYRLSPVCQHPCQFAVTGGGHRELSLFTVSSHLSRLPVVLIILHCCFALNNIS